MKTIALLLFLVPGALLGQEPSEEQKKRLGELIQQEGRLQEQIAHVQKEFLKLLEDLSGGNPERSKALLRETLEKYAPDQVAGMIKAEIEGNQRKALNALRALATAEVDLRANDRDNNNSNDFWVADVSGLYRIDAGSGPLKLIDVATATADAKPCLPLDQAGNLPGAAKEHASKLAAAGKSSPKAGYWVAVVEKYQDEKGEALKYDEGNGRNLSAFGVCAYPAEYGKTGKMTYIVNENFIVWKKDTGGKPPDVFPWDPEKAGWTK